jgi:nucleoside 2-deoxyribosyltransferase
MIYLASPYWHPEPAIRNQRFRAACRITAEMIREGTTVFSPVVYGHALMGEGLPSDWSFWQRHDAEYLMLCDEVVILQIDGWEASEGVREEVRLAIALGKAVTYRLEQTDMVAHP